MLYGRYLSRRLPQEADPVPDPNMNTDNTNTQALDDFLGKIIIANMNETS